MSWISFSLFSAVLSGVAYTFYGELIKKISIDSVIFYSYILVGLFFFFVTYFNGSLSSDWDVIKKSSRTISYLFIIFVADIGASFCLFMGMKMKNATAAGLLEISAPLFTLLFAWILFKQSHLSLGLVVGGVLIMSGIACVMYLDKSI